MYEPSPTTLLPPSLPLRLSSPPPSSSSSFLPRPPSALPRPPSCHFIQLAGRMRQLIAAMGGSSSSSSYSGGAARKQKADSRKQKAEKQKTENRKQKAAGGSDNRRCGGRGSSSNLKLRFKQPGGGGSDNRRGGGRGGSSSSSNLNLNIIRSCIGASVLLSAFHRSAGFAACCFLMSWLLAAVFVFAACCFC